VRTALISDIHSNLSALEAVLAEIDKRSCQRILCLGDIIGYGPNPVQCADAVAERCEWSLLGNHDFGVLYEPTNFNSIAEQAAYWTREQFERDSRENPDSARKRWNFLGLLPVRKREGDYLFVHGTPRKPINEYLFPEDAINSPAKLASIFDRIDRVCFVGHTHVQGVFTDDGEFWKPDELTDHSYPVDPQMKAIINPGSVGQPRDGDPRAAFAILDTSGGDGKHRVEFHRVEYDIEDTIERIHSIDRLNDFLGDRLREGR
jgi:diadenosine tetraphosphatase ApaH/serine/threonine PP2A family protein phosphatase